MRTLTNEQRKLLDRVLSGTGPASASVNALKFRAAHEDFLADLDQLESRRLIARKENKYFLSLLALVEIQSQSVMASRICVLCSHLFGVLRRVYKYFPGQQIRLSDLASLAELPI